MSGPDLPDDVSLDESVLDVMGSPYRGILITFEGLDGTGKSTQIGLLARSLRDRGYDVLETREPGGTELGETVRSALLDADNRGMSPRAEALLYAAVRAQLVDEIIRPALEQGRIVLCDRYLDSSLAYQGYGRGLGAEDVITLNIWATDSLFPDLTFLLLGGEDVRAERTGGRTPDRVEEEGQDFFRRVEEGYRQLARDHRHRIQTVEAGGSREEVQESIRAVVDQEFGVFSS